MDPGSIQAETSMGAYVNAASSQPPAYEEQDEDSDSSEDYAELYDYYGSDYYDQVVRLLSYKSKYNKIKAQKFQLRQDKATLLKQCQNWRAKCIKLAKAPIQRQQKVKHKSSSSKSMQPTMAIGQAMWKAKAMWKAQAMWKANREKKCLLDRNA